MTHPRFKAIPLGRPWCCAIELSDGQRFLMRPIQPSDAPLLQQGFLTLTPEEIRMRFLHPLTELSTDYAKRLSEIDPAKECALVLVEAKPPPEARIAAVARAAIDEDGSEAEFAIIVSREIRRFGLGRFLMKQLASWARSRQLLALYGLVLKDNTPMLRLMSEMGFSIESSRQDSGVALVRLAL